MKIYKAFVCFFSVQFKTFHMSYDELKLVTYEKCNCDVQNCILNTFIKPHHFT